MLYLAEKTGRYLPERNSPEYWNMMQWLMWQMGGFGPIIGQAHHFLRFNPGKSTYSEARFHDETKRLYGVLDGQLGKSKHIAGDLSIADFAVWPWVARFDYHQIDLNDFPKVKKWYLQLAERPTFRRGYSRPKDVGPIPMPK